MIAIGTRTKIFVYTQAVDFRKAFRGLSGIVRSILNEDPLNGHAFVFRNRRGNGVKIICFDGRASWTFHIKFAQGKLSWWPTDSCIHVSQLMSLLSQGKVTGVGEAFREIA